MSSQIILFRLMMKASRSVQFSSYSGYACQYLLYELLSRFDKLMARKLHEQKGHSPYSITPLMLLGGNPVMRYLDRGSSVQVTINVMVEGTRSSQKTNITREPAAKGSDLAKALTKIFERLDEVVMNEVRFIIDNLEVESIPFSLFWNSSKEVLKFSCSFVTPTRFSMPLRSISGNVDGSVKQMVLAPTRYVLYPDAERMLASLAGLWAAFASDSPINIDEYRNWLKAGGVVCSGYPKGIRTVSLRPNGSSVGFLGQVRFTIPDDELYFSQYARFTEALLRMGQYTNVGDERTAGLGVIQYRRYD
jgi:CRISPR/Cas system endoribonuclease Cas6 (RAMP superfamily)